MADTDQLVTLQRGLAADSPAIYCFPGAGDSVTCFLAFSNAMGDRFTVHGAQPRGLDGMGTPHASVEDMVRDNIHAIRRIHAGGPYRLVGHSFGGWIALELALQLTAAGERVETVVLLDTDPPTIDREAVERTTRIDAIMELIRNLEDKAAQRFGIQRSELEKLPDEVRLHRLMDAMKAARLFPLAATLPSIASMVDVFEANLRTSYVPSRPLTSDILLVHPELDSATGGDYVAGEQAARSWQRYSRITRRIVVPGTHMRMLSTPTVDRIVAGVRAVWRT